MAAAFAKDYASSDIEVVNAGDGRRPINPLALQSMKAIGIKIPSRAAYSLNQIKSQPFDIVVTLCNQAKEICPTFPGSPARIHWPLIDPGRSEFHQSGNGEKAFSDVRDEIRHRVSCLFQSGFIDTVREQRLTFGSLLDNLTDGVMAHDMDRRIYFFNQAAQRITGYNLNEVIGRDCHEVFPGRFCGGDCSFCDDKVISHTRLKYPASFKRKSGEKIAL